jgi:hypothetical protein
MANINLVNLTKSYGETEVLLRGVSERCDAAFGHDGAETIHCLNNRVRALYMLRRGREATSLARDVERWALFTGLISYILIGTLFAGEYLYRHWRFRRFVGGFADPLLKWIFPPRSQPSSAPSTLSEPSESLESSD